MNAEGSSFPNIEAIRQSMPLDAVAELVAEFNARYFVVNEHGKTIIYVPKHDQIQDRKFFERMSFADFTKLYSNRFVQVGTKKGSPVMRPCADVWLSHPDRHQYIGGIVFDPSNRTYPTDTRNLWTGFAVTPRKGARARKAALLLSSTRTAGRSRTRYRAADGVSRPHPPGPRMGDAVDAASNFS